MHEIFLLLKLTRNLRRFALCLDKRVSMMILFIAPYCKCKIKLVFFNTNFANQTYWATNTGIEILQQRGENSPPHFPPLNTNQVLGYSSTNWKLGLFVTVWKKDLIVYLRSKPQQWTTCGFSFGYIILTCGRFPVLFSYIRAKMNWTWSFLEEN